MPNGHFPAVPEIEVLVEDVTADPPVGVGSLHSVGGDPDFGLHVRITPASPPEVTAGLGPHGTREDKRVTGRRAVWAKEFTGPKGVVVDAVWW
jgi:hypothetical protein